MARGIRSEDTPFQRRDAPPVIVKNCWCTVETTRAIQVQHKDWRVPKWVPKSVIDDDSDVFQKGTNGNLVIAAWFAEKEGIK
jgi:hypothetical protein